MAAQTTCAICLDSLNSPGARCRALSCFHVLHEACYYEMLRHSLPDTCPVCRRSCQDLKSVESRMSEAFLCYKQASYHDCVRMLQEILEISPGHVDAACMLGDMHMVGDGIEQSFHRAEELLTVALNNAMTDAPGKVPMAAAQLGRLWRDRNKFAEALKYFTMAISVSVERGEVPRPEVYFHMGMIHFEGAGGVPKNGKLAAEFLSQAVEVGQQLNAAFGQESFLNFIPACGILGMLYLQGDAVAGDGKLAAQFLTMAAEAGCPDASFLVGHMHRHGNGIPVDLDLAENFLLASAKAGNTDAVSELAKLRAEGRKVSKVVLPSDDHAGAEPASRAEQPSSGHMCNSTGVATNMLAHDSCQYCGVVTKVQQCARCKLAFYCSRSCQHADWKQSHKNLCRQVSDQGTSSVSTDVTRTADSILASRHVKESRSSGTIAEVRLDDVEAGIAASLEEASKLTVAENAQISEAVLASSELASVDVAVLEFSQHGKWFLRALCESSELDSIRQPAMPSGAKVFVKPDEVFAHVVGHLQTKGWDLQSRYVVVRTEDVSRVVDVVMRAAKATARRERGGSSCKVKSQVEMSIPTPSLASQDLGEDVVENYIVKRTFVCVSVPSSMYSDVSTHAATA